ncbi:MAG: alpha/beta fold hydrolase [Mycoplasmatales bacterium]|nr:alpha/beta fold hydrolase [Mycoplasmatales bacterium]
MEKLKIKLENEKYTYLYKWCVKSPRAILQIVHGSKENIHRYMHLIKYLNKNDINVLAIDLRGHGKAFFEQNELGNMGINSFVNLVNDVEIISKIIKDEYSNIPYTIYGHSMGSFVVRAHSIIFGAPQYIISGTNEESWIKPSIGIFIAKLTRVIKGKNTWNKLIDNLSYKSFSKKFKKENHSLSWLSNDPKVWDEFVKDPLNGSKFTNESFIGMLKLLKFIRKNNSYKKIKSNHTLLIAGENDPVGRMSKGPKKVYSKMLKQKKCVNLIIYKKGRHEVHNDLNKLVVYDDIVNFILKKNNQKD